MGSQHYLYRRFGCYIGWVLPRMGSIRQSLQNSTTDPCVVLLTVGVYWKGGYSTEMAWRDRVAEVEKKVKIAEAKAKQANTQVQTKIVTKIVKIQEKATVAKETIRRNKEVINRECKLSDEAISAYNFSITKTKPQEKK